MIRDLWYKNALVYCLDVKTFMDSNGDGVGDFEGLMRRLEYLAGMGVTCLWLLPFQPSPWRDNGYDISDYYDVHPKLGTLGDFVEFTHEAKKHGIRVIMDLVINHTSNLHPWFKQARSDPKSPFRDWYIWSKKRPKDADKGMVFPGVQRETWSYDPKAKLYYFHRFFDFQPDLNTSNPDVQTELRRIMGFWLQAGVSGFRIDAVPFVIQKEGVSASHPEMYKQLTDMRTFLQWRTGDAIMLGEANVLPEKDFDYFGQKGDRLHMIFNFFVNQALFLSLAKEDARPLVKALESTRLELETAQWAQFLRNNDELDLGRLSPEDRQKVFAAFGPDKKMQLYDRGLRRRLAPLLEGDRRRIELAKSLMFSLPGTPVMRYGEEIGMGDDLRLEERASVRTPMQWSNEQNGGFSSAKKTILPVIDKGEYGYQRVNVADQRRDPESLLNWTERIIRMRKEAPEIGWGKWRALHTDQTSVIALRFDWRGNSVITLHNLSGHPKETRFGGGDRESAQLVNLLSHDHSHADGRGQHTVDLEAYGYRWYRVGGLRYLQQRTKT